MSTQEAGLESRCDLLRSLHKPGAPLLLPNAWDAAPAKTAVEAGFPVTELAALGVARVFLHWDTMARFKEQLATLDE